MRRPHAFSLIACCLFAACTPTSSPAPRVTPTSTISVSSAPPPPASPSPTPTGPRVTEVREWGRPYDASFGVATRTTCVTAQFATHCTPDRLFLTRNAGRTWSELAVPKLPADQGFEPLFLTPEIGWLLTGDCDREMGTLYRTTDGGRHWEGAQVGSPSCHAGSTLDVHFADPLSGSLIHQEYITGNAWLSSTSDGGATWMHRPSPPLVADVRFRDAVHGWNGGHGYWSKGLFSTDDGGQSWTKRDTPKPHGYEDGEGFADLPTFFGDEGILPVTLHLKGKADMAFFATHDGGATWTLASTLRLQAPARRSGWGQPPIPASIAGLDTWWVVAGKHNTIFVTRDGGRTWHIWKDRFAGDVSVTAVDGFHAWAVSEYQLYATRDGGRTWSRLRPGVNA